MLSQNTLSNRDWHTQIYLMQQKYITVVEYVDEGFPWPGLCCQVANSKNSHEWSPGFNYTVVKLFWWFPECCYTVILISVMHHNKKMSFFSQKFRVAEITKNAHLKMVLYEWILCTHIGWVVVNILSSLIRLAPLCLFTVLYLSSKAVFVSRCM